MKKNILVLTGSPRKNGNSDLAADAFIKGAKDFGHKVEKFRAGKKTVDGCVVCNKCFSKGTACVYKDGFRELAPLLENADMIVFSTPLYFYSFSAQIKTAIDKIYSFHVGKKPLKIKECVLLACGETDDEKDFDGLVKSYELIADFMNWEDKGRLIVTGVNKKGDISKTDALDRAEKLGANI